MQAAELEAGRAKAIEEARARAERNEMEAARKAHAAEETRYIAIRSCRKMIDQS